MTDKMALWDAVSKTNPAHTKHVNQRGGFTAIAAHSQIMEATRQFGPVGIGWGYVNGEPIFVDGIVIVPVTIWHGDRSNSFGPVFGSAELKPVTKSGPKLDSDAPKKAATDGLTKGLSHLGFNADVFLGLFDDNKYVETMREEFAAKEPVIDDAQFAELVTLIEQTKTDTRKFCTYYKIEALNLLPAAVFDRATAILRNRLVSEDREAA